MNVITAIKEIARNSQRKADIIGTIAQVKLGIDIDVVAVHNLSAEKIKSAIEAAYMAGVETGLTLK